MFKFLQPYNFIHCNDSLISEDDKEMLNTKLDNSFEYIKHYKSQCSELSLYKMKNSNKYILISDQECLTQICPSTEFSIESIDTRGELTDLIHTDVTLSTHSFPKNIYKETISTEQLRIDCENKVAKEKLYCLETTSFEAIFTMLYKYMLDHDCAFSIDTDDENKCVEYLDDIHNDSIMNAFMNIYTLMESLEKETKHKTISSNSRQLCSCDKHLNICNTLISIDINCYSPFYLLRTVPKYKKKKPPQPRTIDQNHQQYCNHNIRGLRHAIVHGVDENQNDFTKQKAINIIEQDFNDIIHLMISYIEQELR